jgi:hypothetical protein
MSFTRTHVVITARLIVFRESVGERNERERLGEAAAVNAPFWVYPEASTHCVETGFLS